MTVGGDVTWTITPWNDGETDALAGWSVTDLLPKGSTLKSMTGAGYTCTGTTCVADAPLKAGTQGPASTVAATLDGTATGKQAMPPPSPGGGIVVTGS